MINNTYPEVLISGARVFTVVLLLTACTSTTMRSTWMDPAFNGNPLKKIAVFAVHKDIGVRRVAEEQVVAQISKDTEAVASYTLFEKLEIRKRAEMRDRLIDEGFDGAIVMRLVEMSKHETYVPPQTRVIPGNPDYVGGSHFNSFDDYYGYVQGQVYNTPGEISMDTIAKIETLLYTLPDGKMIWSGISERVNPDSAESVAHELGKLISNDLADRGIVGRIH